MAGGRKIVGLVHVLAALAGAGAMFACVFAGSAAAQILDPPGWRTTVTSRPPAPRLRPTLPDDASTGEEDARAFDSGAFGPNETARAPQPVGVDGIVEDAGGLRPTLADDDAAESEGEEDQPRRVRVPQDGDPVSVIEEAAVQDGIIDLNGPGETAEVQAEITEFDLRSPEDIRAFAGEPAGFDPLLLQANEQNPVFSPSNFQGFLLDPYPPIGTKIGSFLLFTTLEANYDYNSNLFASPNALGDSSLEVRPAARLASNWSRHAVELRASGDLSYHDRYSSEDDRAYVVEGLGRVDITSRSNLQGFLAREYGQESRSAINAESAGTRPNITVDRARAAYNQRFNRLTMQLRGNIVDTSYSTNVFDDQTQSNSDRDYMLYEQAVRPMWEFSPYLFAFADISFNQRDYKIPTFSDGILRSSTGERYRFGVSFGDVSQVLRGTISLGYAHQQIDNHLLPAVDGLLIDADLAWAVTPLTVLSFTATSDVAETTTAYSPGVMERNYGLEARHSFTRYLVGNAGVGYMTRNFINTDYNEEQFTAAVGTEYYANSWSVLFARYQHIDFQSSQAQSSYTAEIVQAGVRLRH
ncbi:polysaccharide biosynthesis protein VpsM [Hyphomicrobium sp. 1Nfss2.1]|uniref:outer membrane beta-barrel protein n=1 Tax=Hyphomicrobium sp. 1Nfss2.1 TaxID=3413936 RepID=UPI003C7AFA31